MAAACALAMDRGKRFCVWLSAQPAGCADNRFTRRVRGVEEPEISPRRRSERVDGGFGDHRSIRPERVLLREGSAAGVLSDTFL